MKNAAGNNAKATKKHLGNDREISRIQAECDARIKEFKERTMEERKTIIELQEMKLQFVYKQAEMSSKSLAEELSKTRKDMKALQKAALKEMQETRKATKEHIESAQSRAQEQYERDKVQLDREHKLKERAMDREHDLNCQIIEVQKQLLLEERKHAGLKKVPLRKHTG